MMRPGLGRRSRLLIALIAIVSVLTVATYAGRRSDSVPDRIVPPSKKVALTAFEPAKKRSFSPKITRDAASPIPTPSPSQASKVREQVASADPISTGAVSASASKEGLAVPSAPSAAPQVRLLSDQGVRDPELRKKPSNARVRSNRPRPQVALNRPERIVAAAPAATSVCLAFIVCF